MALPSFGPVLLEHTPSFVLLKSSLTFPVHTQPTLSQDVSVDVSETDRSLPRLVLLLVVVSRSNHSQKTAGNPSS